MKALYLSLALVTVALLAFIACEVRQQTKLLQTASPAASLEYMLTPLSSRQFVEQMNRLAENGWEIVSIRAEFPDVGGYEAILKRHKLAAP